MAWINDSLRAAIAAVNPFGMRGPQQSIADRYFTPQLAIAAYLSSGMTRKVIDIPAQDRVREWRDWQAPADAVTKLEEVEKRLALRQKVRQAEVLRGLGGGALILALPGDLATPAPANAQITAINVASRWQLSLVDVDDNMASPTYGEPAMFRINAGATSQQDIHPSRVIAFRGDPIPSGWGGINGEDAYWGASRLERVLAAVQKADNAALWFAELVKKAKLLRVGIANLTDYQTTEQGRQALAQRVALIAEGENSLNATVFNTGDGKNPAETITDYQVKWDGIPALMDAFDQRVAAVADIPFTRLMGRSPAGMNATGEHDAANWAAAVAAGQELELRPCLERLDPFLFASAGVAADGVWWSFTSIYKPSAKEEADRFKTTMDAVKLVGESAAIPERAFNAGVQSVIEANGWMPGMVPELAKLSEDERFGLLVESDDTDPSALANNGEEVIQSTGRSGGGDGSETTRRAANDKVTGGDA